MRIHHAVPFLTGLVLIACGNADAEIARVQSLCRDAAAAQAQAKVRCLNSNYATALGALIPLCDGWTHVKDDPATYRQQCIAAWDTIACSEVQNLHGPPGCWDKFY